MKYIMFTLVSLFFIQNLSAQKSVPAVDVQTLEGERVNLSDYTGKGEFTILSFWATWCKPCKT